MKNAKSGDALPFHPRFHYPLSQPFFRVARIHRAAKWYPTMLLVVNCRVLFLLFPAPFPFFTVYISDFMDMAVWRCFTMLKISRGILEIYFNYCCVDAWNLGFQLRFEKLFLDNRIVIVEWIKMDFVV